jgi:hypothetical protein
MSPPLASFRRCPTCGRHLEGTEHSMNIASLGPADCEGKGSSSAEPSQFPSDGSSYSREVNAEHFRELLLRKLYDKRGHRTN